MATALLPSDDVQTNTDDKNFEIFCFIWLDENVNVKVTRYIEQKLRSIINHLEKFQDIKQCQQYIEQRSKNDRLILIVGGQVGREIVPSIHNLQQVISIYVYCMDKKSNEQWPCKFPKVKSVVVELDELISQIREDHKIQKKVKESLPMNFFTKKNFGEDKSTSILNGEFIFYQVLIHCLLRLKYTQIDKAEFVKHYRLEYEGDRSELNKLCEFEEEYSSDNVLSWYTRESFLYKTLNAALRTQNIHIIFLFRAFISDIQHQLQCGQVKTPLRVYRSQMLSNDELDVLKRHIGQLISIRSFFSTSTDRKTALFFLGNTNSLINSNLKGVLFEIDADPQMVTTKPFADISKYSHFINESEVLFMIGSIFRVQSISCSDDHVWIIEMSLCSDDENDLKEVLLYMKQQIGNEETNLQTLAKLLWKMGRFDLAEKYFKRLLNELSPNDPLIWNLYEDLGELASHTRDYDMSVHWKQKALEFKMQSKSTEKLYTCKKVSIRSSNLETYSLLWLDGLVNSNENCNAQQQLRSTINHIRVFENGTECETYIRESKDDKILLIVSGQVGSIIVPLIHSLRQINSIYIYCVNSSKHQEWTSKFTKIRAVVTDLNELIEKINVDRKRREKSCDDHLSISIFNSMSNEERSSTNINSAFLHFQLLIDGLLRLPYSQTSRNEFFNLCKYEYEGNYAQLSILKEFEKDYKPERALYWYTRHSFLYKMLNKALRVQNIDVLFLFRFFIQDLYQQLKNLQQEQNQTSMRVYRSQLMSKEELNVLKKSKGQFISMNSFLSTSLSRQNSLSFVPSEYNDLCPIVFEIDVDSHLSDGAKPFANISSQSEFENEQEILFMIATIFRLVDIHQENQITVIRMKLCNGNYEHDMKPLLEYMQMENEEFKCLSLGHTLRSAGMHDKAEQFYKRMLNELTDDHPLIVDLWSSIGIVKRAKGEIEISSEWLNKSFKKYEQMGDHLGFAKCLQDLGNIHQMKGEFNHAINKYNQALNIFKDLFGAQNKLVANCLNNLGVIYFKQHKFTEAVQHYIEALNIRNRIFPYTHPDIARTLNNIGNACFANDECDSALQYFDRALDIYKISLLPGHPSIAQTYYNMGLTYLKKGDDQKALAFLNRAASIHHSTLSSDPSEVHRCDKTIDYIKQKYNKQGTSTERTLHQTICQTEHVQLVKYQRSIEYITVESASLCCNDLIDLSLTCNDGNFVDEDTSVQLQTFKRSINFIVACLGVTLPSMAVTEYKTVQIISFDDACTYVSELLSIKDKLIYVVISITWGDFVVPLIYNHTYIEHIYIHEYCCDEKSMDWTKDYPRIRSNVSSIDLLAKIISEDIGLVMKRPLRWSRSKALLTELCLQMPQIDIPPSINKTTEDDLNTWRIVVLYLDSLRPFQLSHPKIKIDQFDNTKECVRSIEIKGIPVFLIISVNEYKDIRIVTELDAVHALYVVGNLKSEEQVEMLSTYLKLSGVFVLNEDLLEQLTTDICFYRHTRVHTPPMNIFKIESNILDRLTETQKDFLCFQLFSDILLELPTQSTNIADNNTENDNQSLSRLVEANIKISHLFNQFDIFTLRKSTVQLKNINHQIVSMTKTPISSFVTVYRAQLVSQKDIEMMKDNSNALLTIEAFVLASRCFKSVAEICRRAVNSQLIVVLFELKLSDNTIVASSHSNTVIFGLGTLFRLVSVDSGPDGVWRVQLEIANMEMQSIRDQLRIEIGSSLTWLTFGIYLAAFKRFNAAQHYYEYLQQMLPQEHPNLTPIYNNMGLMYLEKKDDITAFELFKKALQVKIPESSVADKR